MAGRYLVDHRVHDLVYEHGRVALGPQEAALVREHLGDLRPLLLAVAVDADERVEVWQEDDVHLLVDEARDLLIRARTLVGQDVVPGPATRNERNARLLWSACKIAVLMYN